MKRSSLQQTGLHSSEVGLLNKSSAQALCVAKFIIVVDMILVTLWSDLDVQQTGLSRQRLVC